MKKIFWAAASCILLVSCQGKNNSNLLIGKWNATWTNVGKVNGFSEDQLMMKGRIRFLNNGTCEFEAYGFEGCIFFQDTLKSNINYDLQENVLFVSEEEIEKQQGIEYKVVEQTEVFCKLKLLDDIVLELQKIG